MIQNDARAREIQRQPRRFRELRPWRLQVEAQPSPGELREAGAPALVGHLPGARLMPDAAHEIELRQRLDRSGGIVPVQPGLRNRHAGKPGLAAQPLDVAHLAEGVARIPFGFHVHSLCHYVGRSVGEIVGRQIGPPQSGIVAVAERDRRLVAKPWVIVDARVPEMLVCVDDRERHW